MDGEDIAVPSVFIVGTDGHIRFRYIGESVTDRPSPADLLAEVEKIKAQSPKP